MINEKSLEEISAQLETAIYEIKDYCETLRNDLEEAKHFEPMLHTLLKHFCAVLKIQPEARVVLDIPLKEVLGDWSWAAMFDELKTNSILIVANDDVVIAHNDGTTEPILAFLSGDKK